MNHVSASVGQMHYRKILAGVLLALAILLIFVWLSLDAHRQSLRREIREQTNQIALALQDEIDVVRSHVFIAQKTVEHDLVRAGVANKTPESLIRSESAALLVAPSTVLNTEDDRVTLSSVTKMLPAVAAAHQWNSVFEWTYFYDAKARWVLIYPYLSQEELFRTTRTGDLAAALKVFFDADGTRPLEMIGPRNNSGREMRWTRSYDDAGGKGRMVSLLAPVYLADRMLGAIGADVTLKQLDGVLQALPIRAGRVLVMDQDGGVLADSGGALSDNKRRVLVNDLLSGYAGELPQENAAFQRIALRGTAWTLLLEIPESELMALAVKELSPLILLAGLLMMALLGLFLLQQRRQADAGAASVVLEQTRGELARADRLGTLGGLVASVAREVELPLRQAESGIAKLRENLTLFRQQVERGLRRSELDEFVARLDQENLRLTEQLGDAGELLHSFRQLALDQTREGARQVALHALSENVVAVLRPLLKRQGCRVENAIAPDLVVSADGGMVGQLLHYLLGDAIERCRPGQTLNLRAGWCNRPQGEFLEIILSDQSPLPPDLTSGNLALAKRLVHQEGGGLEVECAPEGSRLHLLIRSAP